MTFLTPNEVMTIADAVAARERDSRAMDLYLHPDVRLDQFRTRTPADLVADAEAGAFDSAEQSRVRALIQALSNEARTELLALMWLGRGDTNDFATALAHARRTSHDGIGWLPSGKAASNLSALGTNQERAPVVGSRLTSTE
jgi:hypothetical protein